MEFLMTYGWALLVVLIAIAALAFFGLLNPSNFLPERCVIGAGLACIDYRVQPSNNNTVSLIIQNGLGTDLLKYNMYLEDCNGQTNVRQNNNQDYTFIAGKKYTFNFSCSTPPTTDTKLRTDIIINYTTSNGFLRTQTGTLIARVE